jgi:hypothetical protein
VTIVQTRNEVTRNNNTECFSTTHTIKYSTWTRNNVTSTCTDDGQPNSERQRTSKRSAQYNECNEAVRSRNKARICECNEHMSALVTITISIRTRSNQPIQRPTKEAKLQPAQTANHIGAKAQPTQGPHR